MKIYTRKGDQGETSIIGGRVRKDDARVEAYGTVDELNSYIGHVHSVMEEHLYPDLKEQLIQVMHELFDCGSDLAMVRPGKMGYKVHKSMIDQLEVWIDQYEEETPEITRFILPGGSQVSALLHVCRTVCRRAERDIVTLASQKEINEEVIKYMNRLSDLLFIWARVANVREKVEDIEYVRSAEVFHNRP